MTRKDLETKYNIIGNNNDIALCRKRGEFNYGIGYCGNISLKNGKAVFNGKSYADIASLDNALVEYAKTLPYPIDTYFPQYREGWKVESRIIWYLTEKMGFKAVHHGWDLAYERAIGPSFSLAFYIDKEKTDVDGKVVIVSKYAEYHFRSAVDNAEDGIATINTIVNTSILEMAKDMVDTLSVCDNKVMSEIEAYVPSNKSIFGVEKVSFKDMMIAALENQLKALKGE